MLFKLISIIRLTSLCVVVYQSLNLFGNTFSVVMEMRNCCVVCIVLVS